MHIPDLLSIVLALAAAFSFFLAGYAFSRERFRGAGEFAGMMSASALYALGYALEITRVDLTGMLWALRVEYVGVAFICYFWLLFALRFTDLAQPGPLTRTLLAVPSVAVVLLFWSDPLHHLFYERAWVRTDTPFPLIGVERGPAYWVHIVVSQIEIVIGVAILIVHAIRTDPWRRRQAQAVAVASLFPWVSFAVYIAGWAPWDLDLTPLGTIGSGLMAAFGLFRLGVLELVPAARALAIDSLRDGLLVLDRAGAVADFNPAASELLAGVSLRFGDPPGARAAGEWFGVIAQLVAVGEGQADLRAPRADGTTRSLTVQCIPVRDATSTSGTVLVIRDVSDTTELLDRLTAMAITDPLTGLANRRQFFEYGARAIGQARRHARPLAVAVFDLDHFKQVNDRYGHDAGDFALRAVADRLRTTLRTSDLLCRYGGEELAILMPDTDLESALRAADRFREDVGREPFEWNGQRVALTTSVGVYAAVPDASDAVEQFVSRADAALYRAKSAGRNRCEAWQPDHAAGAPATPAAPSSPSA